MTVPDEAVVAAMKASWSEHSGRADPAYVRNLLTAAAPVIAAQALEDAARDVAVRGDIGRDGGISAWVYLNSRAELVRTNPYRSGT